jgi:hypothetical protein
MLQFFASVFIQEGFSENQLYPMGDKIDQVCEWSH